MPGLFLIERMKSSYRYAGGDALPSSCTALIKRVGKTVETQLAQRLQLC